MLIPEWPGQIKLISVIAVDDPAPCITKLQTTTHAGFRFRYPINTQYVIITCLHGTTMSGVRAQGFLLQLWAGLVVLNSATRCEYVNHYIDGLVQEYSNSNALAVLHLVINM